jgi:hypothetical protein
MDSEEVFVNRCGVEEVFVNQCEVEDIFVNICGVEEVSKDVSFFTHYYSHNVYSDKK